MSNPIGGFFELELSVGEHFHPTALRLNTARNCFAYILQNRKPKKIHIPYYGCDVMLDVINKLDIETIFYDIDDNLDPVEDVELEDDELYLYVNYFGLKTSTSKRLAGLYKNNLILDNAQAFFEKPIPEIDTVYSPRKFFGVPDGGYVYTSTQSDSGMESDKSWSRGSHLLKRIDEGPQNAYEDYRSAEEELKNKPILRMSHLTEKILESIDYINAKKKRINNYLYLESILKDTNEIKIPLTGDAVPMVYPYKTTDNTLRARLITNEIFVATYWPDIPVNIETIRARETARDIIPLPIDQRYDINDLKRIGEIIHE